MKNTSNRIVWVDILRIVATWGVIIIHGRTYDPYEVGTVKWIENSFAGNLFTCCVPIFIMLSGMLMLKHEHIVEDIVTKKAPKIVLMKIVSMFICGMTGFLTALLKQQTLESAWEKAKNTSYTWAFGNSFFAVLFGCYLMTPFLYKIVQDKKTEIYFLLCAVVFCLIIPPFTDLDYVAGVVPHITKIARWFDNSQIYVPVGSTILFVGGAWLDRICHKISKITATLLLCSGILVWQGISFWFGYHPDTNNILYMLRWGRYYGAYISPCIIYYSVTVFIFFKVVIGDIQISNRVIPLLNHVGRNCTYIFIVHGIIISILNSRIPQWPGLYTVEIVVKASIYFIIGYILSLLFEHLPIIRKVVDM